jgi:glycosyltransferase involved in cell wall biosynthesis/GT2 family glycosyltransferase
MGTRPPDHPPREEHRPGPAPARPRRTVSLITTVLNERASMAALLDSIAAQTRPPDEIVIVDAGSDDGTCDIINDYLARGLPARLIVVPGAGRAQGRNLAIRRSRGEIIASIDGGCEAEPEWLARLVAPFESDDPPDVVSGYYRPATRTRREKAVAAATVPLVGEVDPETFLPSSRSVAFTRAAWERAGGYPEYVDCAEDTLFDIRMRDAGCEFQFEPGAVVQWQMQTTRRGLFRQFYRYARSDGETGLWFRHYTKAFTVIGGLLLLLLLTAVLPGVAGTISGAMLLAALLAYAVRHGRRAGRRLRERGWVAVSAVEVSFLVDVAHGLGYSVGRLRRRPRPHVVPANRPLSIAQVTYTYQPITGGADVYVSQLAELFAAVGHRHTVYQRRIDTPHPGVRFVPNPLHGRPLEFWTHTLGLFRLWRELAAHDVVICHYPPYLLALFLMSLLTRGPVRVGISHGVFWDDEPRALRSRFKAWIARLAFRRAHLYIANDTEFLRAMGLRLPPMHRAHAEVAPGVWFVPNGVDVERFRPVNAIPELRALNAILVPRNLYRNRGIHLAVQAFDAFRQEHPNTSLVIAGGGGQPDYVEEVQSDIARRGLKRAVVFYGSVPHDELPAVYSSARLTLIPSLCGEGTSLSALESMACGTATICTAVAGLKDLPGPHVAPEAEALAEVMRQVYLRRLATGDEQRRIVQERYSLAIWRRSWRAALATAGVPMRLRTRQVAAR